MRKAPQHIRKHGARLSAAFLITGLLLTVAAIFWTASTDVTAQSATVTFTFTRIVQTSSAEGDGEAHPNDLYPKVDVGGQGMVDRKGDLCCAHGWDFEVSNWVFTRTVDTSQATIPIIIQLYDQDDLSADDEIDVSPQDGRALTINLSLTSCTWQGAGMIGAANTQSSSQGNETDAARIYFVVSTTAPACRDSDADGLLDGWETNGYDHDADGNVDVNLPAIGANPNRKDLFLELDYMVAGDHSHVPSQNAISSVVRSFANAPVTNLDGTTGIQLHIDVGTAFGNGVTRVDGSNGVSGTFGNHGGGGNQISEAGNTIIDWDGAMGNAGTNFFTLKNMNADRVNIFRYGIFAHQTNSRRAMNDCTSGQALGIPGTNFFVTLGGVNTAGNPCWSLNGGAQSVGDDNEQGGTLMHEYGHVLGLRHGGGDSINDKPNYLSVMNYSFQACRVPASPTLFVSPLLPGGCDFSRRFLPNPSGLNETSLDECSGIDDNALNFGPVDWNGDGSLQGTSCSGANKSNIQANINGDFDDQNNNDRQDMGESDIIGTLQSFDDWSAIVYNHRMLYDFATAGAPTEHEPDPERIERSREFLASTLSANLTVDATGPASARPGDTISYSLAFANSGRGPALHVSFIDTRPNLTTVTGDIGTLQVNASAARNVSYAIGCSVTDGTILTNSVATRGIDLLSNLLTANDAVQTTVQAPKLTLTKTATASVNAGEAITYTIQYENAGTGAAAQVAITDTLPAGVYYSAALDQGTIGPRPSSVTLNSDGTRTLRWTIGTLGGSSGAQTITYTARPTLLARAGATYTNNASLSFTNENGCTYDALTASATTAISEVPATLDPLTIGYWRTHPEEWTAEILARIQATDQRFDRVPASGALLPDEVVAAFSLSGMPYTLEQQLLATYFNLATRRLNPGTLIDSRVASRLGLVDVGGASEYGVATLTLPVNNSTKNQYSDATTVLDEINRGRSIK